MTFEIDGTPVKDPLDFSYEEAYSPFRSAFGIMTVSPFRSAVARFGAMTTSEFSAWAAADDGETHSIVCFSPTATSTISCSSVFIEYLGARISSGLAFYEAEFLVRRITTSDLGVFGEV